MTKSGMKTFLIGMLVAFAIFYGIDMANKGTDSVTRPPSQDAYSQAGDREKDLTAVKRTVKQPAKPPVNESADPEQQDLYDQPLDDLSSEYKPIVDSPINRVGNKTGDLLQTAAHNGIQFVVSIFDRIFQ